MKILMGFVAVIKTLLTTFSIIKTIVKVISFLILLAGLIIGINYYETAMYNNGICPTCEEELEAIGSNNIGQTIWFCEDCNYKCYYR